MSSKKYWYAVMVDKDDNDCGTGSFDLNDAMRMMHELNECFSSQGLDADAYIAIIDADFDDDGQPTTDPLCIDTISDLNCYDECEV